MATIAYFAALCGMHFTQRILITLYVLMFANDFSANQLQGEITTRMLGIGVGRHPSCIQLGKYAYKAATVKILQFSPV